MRCTDLTETWTALRDWLDQAGVLILPRLDRLDRDGPTVRLDAEVDHTRPATAGEVDRVIRLLRAVIERFGAPAVYVGQTAWDRADDGHPGSLAIVTVRVPAGGVLHELTLVAAWYAALLSSDADSRATANRNSDWWPAA